MDKFLETSAQPKLIQEETNSLNRHNKEILKIMKGFLTPPPKKKAKPRWSHSKICPDFQRKTTSSASQVIQKKKRKEMVGAIPNSHETSITLILKSEKDRANKREQRATVPVDHRFKTIQLKTCKLNSGIYQDIIQQ